MNHGERATGTRRLVALLLLAGGGWVQSGVMDCAPVAPGGTVVEGAPAAAHGDHAMHAGMEPSAGADEEVPEHTGDSCRLLMGCGATALSAPPSAAPAGWTPAETRMASVQPDRLSAAYLTNEPPPPRL